MLGANAICRPANQGAVYPESAGCEEFVISVSRTPMASVDAAWLGMEDPTNLMMVTGVMALDGPLDLKRFRLVLDRRLAPFSHFPHRVVRPRSPASIPTWGVGPNFHVG